MKSSTIDHIKHLKPTFFGLFETQYASLLENVYAYIYNKKVKSYPAITSCRGPVSGGSRNVTLAEVQGEFNAYRHNPELQARVLARVNQYVTDFAAATVIKPSKEQTARLLEVRDYFRDHIQAQTSDSTQHSSPRS